MPYARASSPCRSPVCAAAQRPGGIVGAAPSELAGAGLGLATGRWAAGGGGQPAVAWPGGAGADPGAVRGLRPVGAQCPRAAATADCAGCRRCLRRPDCSLDLQRPVGCCRAVATDADQRRGTPENRLDPAKRPGRANGRGRSRCRAVVAQHRGGIAGAACRNRPERHCNEPDGRLHWRSGQPRAVDRRRGTHGAPAGRAR
ncbi:hypothetical protein D3C75_878610 [compost metagenome]